MLILVNLNENDEDETKSPCKAWRDEETMEWRNILSGQISAANYSEYFQVT
jgi:hypothetical protein